MWDLEICGLSHEYPKYLDFQWLPQHLHSHTKLWKWFLEVFTFIFTFKQPQTYRTAHIRTICPHSQNPLYLGFQPIYQKFMSVRLISFRACNKYSQIKTLQTAALVLLIPAFVLSCFYIIYANYLSDRKHRGKHYVNLLVLFLQPQPISNMSTTLIA